MVQRGAGQAVIYFMTYLVSPFITFILSFRSFLISRSRTSLFFLFLFFGLFGYVLNVPYNSDMDLMRLYNAYDLIKELPLLEAWPIILSVGDLSYMFFWILGQFDIPTQFIGFLSAAWFYGAWLLLILNMEGFFQQRFSAIFVLALCVIFVTLTHPAFFNGIRSSSGTMLAMMGTLYLFRGATKRGFYWLVLACLFHFSFVPYLLLCLCLTKGGKKWIAFLSVVFVLGAFLYPVLMKFLSAICSQWGIIGEVISQKILSYSFEKTSDSAILTYGSGWRFIDNVFLFMACTVIRFLPAVRRKVRENSFLQNFDRFLWLFLAFCLFISSNRVMLGRYITILNYLNILFVASLFFFFKKRVLTKYVLLLACCSVMLSCIAVYREMIGGDALYYVYYPKVLYQDLFSISSIQIDYGKY